MLLRQRLKVADLHCSKKSKKMSIARVSGRACLGWQLQPMVRSHWAVQKIQDEGERRELNARRWLDIVHGYQPLHGN